MATGVLRIVADRHWTTDVLAGWASGFFFGYWLPKRWYYSDLQAPSAAPPRAMVLPFVSHRTFGLQLTARF